MFIYIREQAAEKGIESEVLLANEEVCAPILSSHYHSLPLVTRHQVIDDLIEQKIPFEENSVDIFLRHVRFDQLRLSPM